MNKFKKLEFDLDEINIPLETLPEPRLELVFGTTPEKIAKRADKAGVSFTENYWLYRMVYKHFTNQFESKRLIGLPMGLTWTSCENILRNPDEGMDVSTPFREGVHVRHDMEKFNLPGYVIWGGKAYEIKQREKTNGKEI